MAQEIFKRIEKKYLLKKDQYDDLMIALRSRTVEDQYGKHTIRNIYLDTDDYYLIRTSLDKPSYKEKLRVRSYGRPRENDPVYIELKKKYHGVVYKRRAELAHGAARQYLCHGCLPDMGTQIVREIEYARGLYEAKPRVFLAYERIAYDSKEDPELRITFDSNIRGRTEQLDLGRDGNDYLISGSGDRLMEIKIPGSMPMWLSLLLSELHIYPVSYSKYGVFYQQYILPQIIAEKEGIVYA